MDIDLDNLLALPKTGGAIEGNFTITTRDELEKKKADIHTTPIIMTEKTPSGTGDLAEVTGFFGVSGLQVTDILAFNGEAVRKLITTPKDTGKGINEKLFLIGNTYEKLSELVEKQVAFICLFHHLFFLAKLAKTKGYPMFTDSFSDKFNAIQMSLQEIQNVKLDGANKSTVEGEASLTTKEGFDAISSVAQGSQGPPVSSSIFGVSFTDITKFWNEMKSKISLTDMIAVFKKNPTEIYDWFISDISAVPGAGAAGAGSGSTGSGSGSTGSGGTGTSTKSVVDGANLKKETADFIDKIYNKSGHGEAPPETPPPPPPEDNGNNGPPPPPPEDNGNNGPPPTVDKAKKNMKRIAAEKGLATKAAKKAAAAAAAAAAGTTQGSRAAKLAAKGKIEQTTAGLKPGAAAATGKHKAVNNSDSEEEEEEEEEESTTGIPET